MKVTVNNITLNYTINGSGSPLILLHGNGEDLHIFDKLVDKLEQHFRVYAIDSRNHGESSKTDDYTYESMTDDIYQFIELLELKKPLVIGFSDGAIISLLLEMKYPSTFSKMILLGINLSPKDFKPEVYNYIAEEYEKTKDPLFKMMMEQPNIDLNELKLVETHSLIVGGDDDLYKDCLFANIVETMPNAELKIMEGHDHGSYILNTDILYNYLNEFLGY